MRRPLLLALALCANSGAPVHAQDALAFADSLLSSGQLFRAESLYYREAARRPRDPAARLALGRYLAGRGAWRVGAVLMEEARYFGGDADTIGRYLAPVYVALRDYKALSGLRGTPLGRPERLRAEHLARYPPTTTGPDSTSIQWVVPAEGLGAITIIAGSDTILAELDPRETGIVLGPGMRARRWLTRFPPRGTDPGATTPAVYVASRITLGEIVLTGVPVRIDASGTRARIGVDVLERLAPTFDPRTQRVLLRRNGRLRPDSLAATMPTLRRAEGLAVAWQGSLLQLDEYSVAQLLRTNPWTLDARRGMIRVHQGN